jgi:hypothetical protein
MPELGKIVTVLQQAAEGLGKAQSAAAQVDVRAQQVQSRAARSGFRTVAERTGHCRDHLKRIREMQAGVARTVQSTGNMIQRATEDMSPADVVSTLSPAAERIGSASTGTSAVLAELDGLKSEIAAALKGGQPRPLVALVDQLKQTLTQVVASLGAAKQRTDETIAEARLTGNLLDGGGGSNAGNTLTSPDPNPDNRQPEVARFSSGTTRDSNREPETGDARSGGGDRGRGDGRPVPEWVKELADTLQHPDTDQTVGRLALHNRERIGGQILSGRVGPAEQLEGLRTDLPSRPPPVEANP